MALRVIQAGNGKAESQKTISIPAGKWSNFYIHATGTNAAGETLAVTEIGSVVLERRLRFPDGRVSEFVERQRETLDFYYYLADLKAGMPWFTSTIAGAAGMTIPIPVALPGLPNSLDIKSNEEASLTIYWNATGMAKITAAGWNWKLVGELEEIPETYELDIHAWPFVFAAASEQFETVATDNIAAFFVEDLSDVVSSMSAVLHSATGEAEPLIDSIDDDILRNISYSKNPVAAVTNPLAEVNLIGRGPASEALNDSVDIRIVTSGAGTITVTALSVKPTPDVVSNVSSGSVRARVQARIDARTSR